MKWNNPIYPWSIGLGLSALLAAVMLWTPWPWFTLLFIWLVMVVLLDELAGGWFAYIALIIGWLGLPNHPEIWWQMAPLFTGGLWAYLLLRHTGGLFLLPVAWAGFYAPFFAMSKLVPELDSSVVYWKDPAFSGPLLQYILGLMIATWVFYLSQILWQRYMAVPENNLKLTKTNK